MKPAMMTVAVALAVTLSAGCARALEAKLEESNREVARLQVLTLSDAVQFYRLKHGRYPTSEEGLVVLLYDRTLEKLPKDPWGRDYAYELVDGKPRIGSLGADGTAGGSGAAADLLSGDTVR
jgi:general secretion pathway protein G